MYFVKAVFARITYFRGTFYPPSFGNTFTRNFPYVDSIRARRRANARANEKHALVYGRIPHQVILISIEWKRRTLDISPAIPIP